MTRNARAFRLMEATSNRPDTDVVFDPATYEHDVSPDRRRRLPLRRGPHPRRSEGGGVVPGAGRGQEDGELGDVLGLVGPAERNHRVPAALHLLEGDAFLAGARRE